MSSDFSYRHLYYLWGVVKEGGMAVQTVSTQVRALGYVLLNPAGRGVALTVRLVDESEDLLGDLALHRLDVVIADRAAEPQPYR